MAGVRVLPDLAVAPARDGRLHAGVAVTEPGSPEGDGEKRRVRAVEGGGWGGERWCVAGRGARYDGNVGVGREKKERREEKGKGGKNKEKKGGTQVVASTGEQLQPSI